KERADTVKEPVKFPVVRVFPPSFSRSNLKGANLKESDFFTVTASSEWADFLGSSRAIRTGEFVVWIGSADADALFNPEPENKKLAADVERKLDQARQRLRAAFYMTPIDGAALPDGLAAYLKKAPAGPKEFRAAFRSSMLDDVDPDLACK